jgi:ABC-2 type transport system permease protein
MSGSLVRKLLRDVRLPLLVVALLLAAFQCLWAKITQRITEEILPSITEHLPLEFIIKVLFRGPGQIIQTLIGGESINLTQSLDVLTIGYVHPLTQTIFCVWAIGRASGAIAGEIDRGTMELLLAQPLARYRVVLAHLAVDFITIPILCLSLWAGNWLGISLFGRIDLGTAGVDRELHIDPTLLRPALANAAALMFAVSGYTMWLSARGRLRGKVMGVAVLVTLLQFLVNVVGQMWESAAFLRPFTVFYYYQAQQIILKHQWTVDLGPAWHLSTPLAVNVIVVLAGVGVAGYGLALWTFCRRDLPAPL